VIQAYSLDAWRDFYLALATITGALLGLLFVAMSVRANEIGTNPAFRKRAQISTQGMATILVLSLVALIPRVGTLLFGITVLLVTVVNGIVYVIATGKVVRQVGSQSTGAWIRTMANGVGAVIAISGVVSLWLNKGWGLYLLVPPLLIIIGLWCVAAWHMIVPPEISSARVSAQRHAGADSVRSEPVTRLHARRAKR